MNKAQFLLILFMGLYLSGVSQDTMRTGDTLTIADTVYNSDSSEVRVKVRKTVEVSEEKGETVVVQDCEPEMADGLRSSGKIYVVVAVLGVIFVGIIFFLIYLERRLKKMEKELKE